MTSRSMAFHCLVALALLSQTADAQSAKSETFTLSGGVTTPTSSAAPERVAGGHVQAGLAVRMQSVLSSRFQFSAGYHSLKGRPSPFMSGMPNPKVWIVTGSVVKDIGAIREFRPYLIAGVGTINIDEGARRQSHLHVAGGAGIVLPPISRVRPFIEGRYIRVMGGSRPRFIPLSLGIAF